MSDDWLGPVCGLESPPEVDLDPLLNLVEKARTATVSEATQMMASWMQDEDAVAVTASALRSSPTKVTGLVLDLGSRRGLKGHANRLLTILKKLAREQEALIRRQQLESASQQSLAEILDYPELPKGLTSPPGWSVNAEGVHKLVMERDTGDVQRTLIAARPILITARFQDIRDGTTSLRLEWPGRRRWLHRVVPRATAMDARGLIALAGFDAPIHSGNARHLVEFLAALEAANAEELPEAQVSTVMGWQGKDCTAFLWGHTLLRAGRSPSGQSVSAMFPSQWEEGDVHLLGDAGVTELADGFRASGTWEGWLEVLELARPYPALWLPLYAALIPPLMSFLPTLPNFIVDISGETSMGKTTALRLAASVWGSPDERNGGILRTWDSTRVYIERAAAALGNLPLILDDTKRARRPEDVGKTLYDLASGSGRGRGSIGGIRDTGRWRTVLLSTGEAPATSFTNDGGTRARALCLWGSPFGGSSAVSAVQRITAV